MVSALLQHWKWTTWKLSNTRHTARTVTFQHQISNGLKPLSEVFLLFAIEHCLADITFCIFYLFFLLIYSIDAFSNRGKKMEFATCPKGEVCALRGSHTEQSALTKWKCSQGISRDLNSSSAFFLLRVIWPSSNRIWLVQQWKPLQGPVYGMLLIWDPTIHRVT